jgi:hypothetical protein
MPGEDPTAVHERHAMLCADAVSAMCKVDGGKPSCTEVQLPTV